MFEYASTLDGWIHEWARYAARKDLARDERSRALGMLSSMRRDFNALLAEYLKAPEVTRRRLYLEAMAEVLPKLKNKVIVDQDVKGLLPVFGLSGAGAAQAGGRTEAARASWREIATRRSRESQTSASSSR